MNKVLLVGRLVREPELRYTEKGTAFAWLTVAVKGYYDKSKKETVDDFIPVTVWGKRSEVLAQYAKKGQVIELEGRLKSSSYKDNAGKTIYKMEFIAENFEFGAKPNGGGQK